MCRSERSPSHICTRHYDTWFIFMLWMTFWLDIRNTLTIWLQVAYSFTFINCCRSFGWIISSGSSTVRVIYIPVATSTIFGLTFFVLETFWYCWIGSCRCNQFLVGIYISTCGISKTRKFTFVFVIFWV